MISVVDMGALAGTGSRPGVSAGGRVVSPTSALGPDIQNKAPQCGSGVLQLVEGFVHLIIEYLVLIKRKVFVHILDLPREARQS